MSDHVVDLPLRHCFHLIPGFRNAEFSCQIALDELHRSNRKPAATHLWDRGLSVTSRVQVDCECGHVDAIYSGTVSCLVQMGQHVTMAEVWSCKKCQMSN